MKIYRIENSQNSYNTKQNIAFQREWKEHVRWGAKYIKKTGKTDFTLPSFPDAQRVLVEVANKTVIGMSNMKERIVQVLATAGFGLAITSILPKDNKSKIYPMEHKGDGIYEAKNIPAGTNDKYRYIIVDKNSNVNLVKDPYSKEQDSIHGWSSIYDPENYEWKNTNWLNGKDPRRIVRNKRERLRGLEGLVIEEINIPTLSKEGTFEAAISKIDDIADSGIANAIELLPVENTYSLQWGYDGVDKFAVNPKMGGAIKLKELVDYAHGKGLNVIMDMVPNHMGTDGDYLSQTGPYEKGPGEFGAEFNYEGENNRYVRDWMANAALWWANEFKVDGLRLDMTKKCGSDYLIKQIVSEVNEHNPKVFLIAEDGRDNKESITRYETGKPSHEEELEFIDTQIDFIRKKGWRSTPGDIGFDSEWDFLFMHTLKDAVIVGTSLGAIDDRIKNSAHRVKYFMSHDEIGNEDGTKLIPKVIARYLDLYNKVYGNSEAEKGQRAAHASQKLAELIVSKRFSSMSDEELFSIEKEIGLNNFIDKKALKDAFLTAFAKQKLAAGTVMTVPGPKMIFQGDEDADLSYFKFFREFSDDKQKRAKSDEYKNSIIAEKGYDTLESEARPDSLLGRVKYEGEFKDRSAQMKAFYSDLVKIMNENPALKDGDIVGTFNDYSGNVHIHHLKKGDNEILVIKNFGQGFYDKNYGYYGFPQYGNWEEILSSDDKKYGGDFPTNRGRKDIKYDNQNISMSANSIIVLRKV